MIILLWKLLLLDFLLFSIFYFSCFDSRDTEINHSSKLPLLHLHCIPPYCYYGIFLQQQSQGIHSALEMYHDIVGIDDS